MNRSVWILLLAGLSAFSTGCSSARKARKARRLEAARNADSIAAVRRATDTLTMRADASRTPPSADTVETAALDPSKSSVPSYILSLHGRTTPFRTFSGRAKMEYESGDKSHDFTASFRIRHDSAIWISVVAVGGLVPVARVLITPDSVLYVNYLQREASRMPIEDAARLLPLPARFSQLQALLLGDVLEPTADIISTGRSEGVPVYYVATRSEGATHTTYYNAAPDSSIAGETIASADGSVTKIRYSSYEPVAPRRFSTNREILVVLADTGGQPVRHYMRMKFSDPPHFDEPQDFSFSIPKNYTLK